MPSSNNNKKDESNELTIKEVSSNLDISEATVRKYLKDFDLDIEKGSGNKAIISESTFQALSEIAKLRANGLSIQEIKELKSQKPSKNILDEIEETQSSKADEKDEKGEVEKKSKEELELLAGDVIDEVQKREIVEEDSREEKEEKDEKETTEEVGEDRPIRLEEEQEEGPRRRRGFNYRYVERQISNDSKRISSFRLRLRNPNLSVQDRLFFEEALERRILFLDGWKHILRWISK